MSVDEFSDWGDETLTEQIRLGEAFIVNAKAESARREELRKHKIPALIAYSGIPDDFERLRPYGSKQCDLIKVSCQGCKEHGIDIDTLIPRVQLCGPMADLIRMGDSQCVPYSKYSLGKRWILACLDGRTPSTEETAMAKKNGWIP